MTAQEKKYLFDVITACDNISAFIQGKSEEDYFNNKLLQHGVERALEIIGEALKQVRQSNAAIAQRISNVHRIIALRNRLIHAYDDTSHAVIWAAVTLEIPRLRQEALQLLDE